MNTIIEITKYFIPTTIFGLIVYFIVDRFFAEEEKKRSLEKDKLTHKSKLEISKDVLPQRLQAYERIALFLERIKPSHLVRRVGLEDELKTYEYYLIESIQTEFDHNLSQQIYITPDTWKIIYSAKNATQNFIKQCVDGLDANATSIDLQQAIIRRSIDESSPSSSALLYLQKDVQGSF